MERANEKYNSRGNHYPSCGATTESGLAHLCLFIGNMVSFVGDMLTLLAIPWFVLQTTGSVIQAGITVFCSALPMALSGFFGSALVDRLGYNRTSVTGDTLSGLTTMLITLLAPTI